MDIYAFKTIKDFFEYDGDFTMEEFEELRKLHPDWFFEDANIYAFDDDDSNTRSKE